MNLCKAVCLFIYFQWMVLGFESFCLAGGIRVYFERVFKSDLWMIMNVIKFKGIGNVLFLMHLWHWLKRNAIEECRVAASKWVAIGKWNACHFVQRVAQMFWALNLSLVENLQSNLIFFSFVFFADGNATQEVRSIIVNKIYCIRYPHSDQTVNDLLDIYY